MTSSDSNEQVAVNLSIEVEGTYVRGLPMLVAIVLDVETPGVTLNLLPEATPFDLGNAVGVNLSDPGTGQEVVREVPSGVFDIEEDVLDMDLVQGEPKRLLVDISSLIPDNLPPGTYNLAITYVAPAFSVRSVNVPITLRDPDQNEAMWIKIYSESVARAGSWGDWVRVPPADPSELQMPENAPIPARFHVAMRYLRFMPMAIEQFDVNVLNAVEGIARPEGFVAIAEVLWRRGDKSNYQQIRQSVQNRFKGLDWRFVQIENGGGIVPWA
jgi:hypothetical protein